MKFVVADDMHTPRAILQRILLEAGHEVYAASNGTEAVELVRQHRPEAIIFDISMPNGYTGDQAARIVKKEFPDLKIFLSSNISDENVRRPLEQEIDAHFVVKPFRFQQLLQALERHL